MTRPSRGAFTGSSIFIASSTSRVSPRATARPGTAVTAVTTAGIGARMVPVSPAGSGSRTDASGGCAQRNARPSTQPQSTPGSRAMTTSSRRPPSRTR